MTGGMDSTSWTLDASPPNVSRLRRSVVDFAGHHGVPEPLLADIALAVSEAVTNVVMHAFPGPTETGSVSVSVTVDNGDSVAVRVSDDGGGLSPRTDSPGMGIGLPLIRMLADDFAHGPLPGGGGTELRMVFRNGASQ